MLARLIMDQGPASFDRRLAADDIARGLMRGLDREGWRCLTEVPLATGHRADVMGIDEGGRILIAEVKSSVADFRADRKWRAYLEHCDLFAFAVGPDFPVAILPADAGLLVCDGHGAHALRPPAPGPAPLAPARRRQILVRLARMAADRWRRGVADPEDGLDHGR
jgi:hypothetical protein